MTYCCAMLLDAGLVLASESRTNAGVDRVFTYRRDSLSARPLLRLEESDLYWSALRKAWGEGLQQAFAQIPVLPGHFTEDERPSLRPVADL